MRTNIFSAALVAGLAVTAFCVSLAWAQSPGGANAPSGQPGGSGASRLGINGIAVVDIEYIFKNHQHFRAQMEQMRQRVEAAELEVRRDQEELRKLAEEIRNLTPGSEDARNKEDQLLRKQGDLNVKVTKQKKTFAEEEGRIYYNVSREIDDAVKVIAARSGISLVLRFNGDPVDASDRNDIVRNIGKTVVYNDQRMDITPFVLHELNRGGVPAAANTGPGSTVPVPRR